MHILLLGGQGLLGSAFQKALNKMDIDFQAPPRDLVDTTQIETLTSFVKAYDFDYIIDCVAYTRVDHAEEDQENCALVNVQGLINILKQRIPLVHFSSDYIFNAPLGLEIPENYPRQALNFYGQTKIEAEHVLEQSGIPFWNIRTSWLFGPGKDTFITKILKKAEMSEVLEVVHDQIGRPTFSNDLAEYMIQNFLLHTQPVGHYHLQNSGPAVSWGEIAMFVLEHRGFENNIEYISTAQLDLPAKRPLNSVLKNTKLPTSLRPWEDAVREFLETME